MGRREWTQKYEKTVRGFLMRSYRNMNSRVKGIQKSKSHLYEGKEILSKEDFYNFGFSSPEFYKLFGEYKESGFDRKLCPSPDRKDSSKGYTIDNLQWVTQQINSIRGLESRYGKV